MTPARLNRIPPKDPVSGGELYVSELANDESGITMRGRFEIPRYARLDDDQQRFLETFLRCRGMFNAVERELGISYPTVKSRLESLLGALDLKPIESRAASERNGEARSADRGQDRAESKAAAARRAEILDKLSSGEIDAEEAKTRLKAGSAGHSA